MKQILKVSAFLAVACMVLAGCSKDDNDPKPDTSGKVTNVALNKKTTTIAVEGTEQLLATVIPQSSAKNKNVTWSTSDPNVATVDAEGLVTGVHEGEAVITVTTEDGNFTASCTVTVIIENIAVYVATDLKVGDYFYDDGTTSDGGLRRLDFDTGEQTWEIYKPEPVSGKTVIGIVFTTDVDRISEHEKALGYTKGLVVATQYAYAGAGIDSKADDYAWYLNTATGSYDRDETEIGIPYLWSDAAGGQFALIDGDIDGYYYNQQIRTQRTEDYEAGYYPAFKAAEDFDNQLKAPDNTSGWYMPSSGQWMDFISSMFGVNLTPETTGYKASGHDMQWTLPGTALKSLMKSFLNSKSADDELLDGYAYWVSSQGGSKIAPYTYYDSGSSTIYMYTDGAWKGYGGGCCVRCILSF